MNIGIIGSGNMGPSMGKIWAAKGLFNFSKVRKSCGQLPPRPVPMDAPARPPGRGFRRAPVDSRSRGARGDRVPAGQNPVQLRQLPEAGPHRAGGRCHHVRCQGAGMLCVMAWAWERSWR